MSVLATARKVAISPTHHETLTEAGYCSEKVFGLDLCSVLPIVAQQTDQVCLNSRARGLQSGNLWCRLFAKLLITAAELNILLK